MLALVAGIGGSVLGEFVRERRMALNLTQEDLADAINRNQRFVSRLENNMKELPEPELLEGIAIALHCTVDDLLKAAGYPVGSRELQDDRPPLLWFGTTDDLTDEDKAIVKAVVEQIRRNKRGNREG